MTSDAARGAATEIVIITDINNVWCLADPYGRPDAAAALSGTHDHPNDVFARLFTESAIAVMTQVHQRLGGRPRYVVSSTWRRTFSRSQIGALLARSGLPFIAENLLEDGSWCTPELGQGAERLQEIEAWIAEHYCGQALVVLDDDYSGSSFLTEQPCGPIDVRESTVLCQRGVGLQRSHVATILNILKRQGAHAT
jgi:hypothetical protein